MFERTSVVLTVAEDSETALLPSLRAFSLPTLRGRWVAAATWRT